MPPPCQALWSSTASALPCSTSTPCSSSKAGSTLTGTFNAAKSAKSVTLSLARSSKWTVTGNSYLTVLEDSAGVTEVTNIVGNGHTVYYDASTNPALGGRSYVLEDAGTLEPA